MQNVCKKEVDLYIPFLSYGFFAEVEAPSEIKEGLPTYQFYIKPPEFLHFYGSFLSYMLVKKTENG